MLARAATRQLYDALEEAEITAFLQSRPGSANVIVAGDVFCYFGDMAPAITASCAALKPGGLLFFTAECDETAAAGYALHDSGRYGHAEPYLRGLMSDHGFVDLTLTPETLRQERSLPVAGLVVAGRRPR